jgi:hypothetical protein
MPRSKSRHFRCVLAIYDFPSIHYHHRMQRLRRAVLIIFISFFVTGVAFVLGRHHCPARGLALTSARANFHRLKNRTTLPRPTDFDTRANLEAMTRPGDDRGRWSDSRAATIEGYVVSVANGPLELTNCYVPGHTDIHIHIGLRPDAPPKEQFVVETTPRMSDWAKSQGLDWSEERLRRDLVGRWCRFEGWLFFDAHHADESENIAPGRANNWRATAWEIHPITKIDVIR